MTETEEHTNRRSAAAGKYLGPIALLMSCVVVASVWVIVATSGASLRVESRAAAAAVPAAATAEPLAEATVEPTGEIESVVTGADPPDSPAGDGDALGSRFDGYSIAVVGDSLTLSAADELDLAFGVPMFIDAEAGRSLYGADQALIAAAATRPDILVVGLGTNDWTGPPDYGQEIDDALNLVDAPCTVWVNAQEFRDGLVVTNAAIDEASQRNGFTVARWSDLAGPSELHLSDGYHLTEAGQSLYADLVVETAAASCL